MEEKIFPAVYCESPHKKSRPSDEERDLQIRIRTGSLLHCALRLR